jgi:hypothetical protein
MLRVRMASFSHELLNSSQDPVRKTGLTPLESGCSHERPDNDIRGDGRRPSLYRISVGFIRPVNSKRKA